MEQEHSNAPAQAGSDTPEIALDPRPVLLIPNIRNLWLAGAISQFGDRLNQMALMIIMAVISKNNALSMAILLSFMWGPNLIFAIVAGVVADRWNRKAILIWSDIIRAVLVCIIPLVAITGMKEVPVDPNAKLPDYEQVQLEKTETGSVETAAVEVKTRLEPIVPKNRIWIILCVVALMFGISPFFTPARASMIPHLVHREKLLAVNSLLVSTRLVLVMISMVIATIIVDRLNNLGTAFYLDAATYVISAVFLVFINYKHKHIPKQGIGHEVAVSFKGIVEGFGYIFKHSRVLAIILVYSSMLFLGAGTFSVLKKFLYFAYGYPARDAVRFGIVLASGGIGVAVGSILIRMVGDKVRKGWTFIGAYVLAGIGLVCMHLFKQYWVTCVTCAMLGMSLAPVLTLIETFFQREVPDAFRGRVFAGFEVFIMIGLIGSNLISGGLVEAYFSTTPSVMFAISGTGMFVAAFITSMIRIIREF